MYIYVWVCLIRVADAQPANSVTHTYLSVRLRCRVDHPSLEARAAGFITDYIVLPVGAAAGPSHQPGEAPGPGWACRAAVLFEQTI